MTRNVIWKPLCLAGAAVLAAAAAQAAPTVVVPRPIQYLNDVISGPAQFNAMGFKVEIPNPFQPAYTYAPLATAPDGDTTVDWYDITMRQVVHNNAFLVDDTVPTAVTAANPTGFALLPGFKVWAYGDTASGTATYPGMTFKTTRGRPAKVVFRNNLPTPHILPVDPTMMCGPPGYMGPCPDNRAVVHLHGAHGYDHSDGIPEMWFTPPPAGSPPDALPAQFGTQWAPHDTFGKGGAKVSPYTYVYPNDQEAATLWYHDHGTGVTRLNAYAGLAGFYLETDANEAALQAAGVLPTYPYETGIAFQDKMFWAAPTGAPPPYVQLGGMAYPNATIAGGPIGAVSITSEMFGNVMLANGVAWPKMTVEPRKYRMRLLNGNDSRIMIIQFTQTALPAPAKGGSHTGVPMPFLIIGNEQGLLNNPISVTSLTIMPGMRYDIVVDFTGIPTVPASSVYMINVGPDVPFNGVAPPVNPIDPLYPIADPASTGQLMLFTVRTPLSATPDATITTATALRNAANGTPPLAAVAAPGTAVPNRSVYMKEASDQYGRLMLTLGAKGGAPMGLFEVPTELPALGATEVWEIADITPDAHPIHLHLVKFRLIDREPIAQLNNGTTTALAPYPAVLPILPKATVQTWTYAGAGAATATPPSPAESGWLDTFMAVPGTLTRVQATWDIPGLYVWHCHILSHEEFDMMRQYGVVAAPTGVQLTASSAGQVSTAAPANVTFFAAGLTGNALYPTSQNYEFKYWLKDPVTAKWAVVKNWGMDSNWTWTPPANASGTYYVQVDARTPRTLARQATKVMAYTFTGPPATAVSLSPLQASQPAAAAPASVTFTAASTPVGNYEYRFWLKDAITGKWAVQKPYSTVATWTWAPPANTGGTYYVQVDCRAVGSTVKADVSKVTRYLLTPSSLALTSSVPSPQTAATASASGVTFTATPSPAAGAYEYKFWVRSLAGTWQIGQAYSTTNTYTWFPATSPGTYYIEVDIRPKGSTVTRSAAKVIPFVLQ